MTKNKRVGIIGAGIAGIHMAHQLKKQGFTNVTIFEKSDRIGGMVESAEFAGIPHEMGACYTTPAYSVLYNLMEELSIGDLVPIPDREYCINLPDGSMQKSHFSNYVYDTARKHLPLGRQLPTIVIKLIIYAKLMKYLRIHKDLFGKYEVPIIPEPSAATLAQIDCSFYEFLERNNLLALEGVFRLFITAQCFGYLEELPAFYGLSWSNPKIMLIAIEQMKKGQKGGNAFMLKKGLSEVLNQMILQQNLDIQFNSDVTSIQKHENQIHIQIGEAPNQSSETLDLLFSSLPLPLFAQKSDIQTYKQALYQEQSCAYLNSYLVQTDRTPELDTISSWFDHMTPENDAKPFSQRLSKSILFPEQEVRKGEDIRMWIHYNQKQYSPEILSVKLKEHFKWAYPSGYYIIHTKNSKFFHRWSQSGISNKFPWKLMAQQGLNNIYHIGGSVYYESMASILTYNNMLINKMSA